MRLQLIDQSVNFSCGSCTKCCDQPWHTSIEIDKAYALEQHDFSAYPQVAGKPFYHKSKSAPDGNYILAKGEGTKCIFLDGDGLCIIHKELGPEAKPYACLKFPYMIARTPVDDRVSVDFGCPAAQNNAGTPLRDQTDAVSELIPLTDKPANRTARISLDAEHDLSMDEWDALCDRLLRIFDERSGGDIWSRFAESLCLAVSVGRFRRSQPDSAELASLLASDAPLPDAPDVPEITAYAHPSQAPNPSRLLFAATLFRDTCPAGAGMAMGLWKRLSLMPKLMSLAKLSGGYASRLLGRNISIGDVMAHPLEEELSAGGTELLLRYYRSRIWQRLQVGTRQSVVGGLHQHIQDLNAMFFFARAESLKTSLKTGQVRLSDDLIRFGLNRVEFHLANQARLFDQNNMVGWFDAHLQNPTTAIQSLRMMALKPAPKVASVSEE